ncbi:EAL domain-containing protein [Leptolyngbya ohadii]|uniref:EAL domain-containing protein n=1 Tax=Leptolyngbya ohadii TaxID=1962290 RepID=UPI0015C66A32|nr:EAL domain-containing protein [Leptolyngbya ohadii]
MIQLPKLSLPGLKQPSKEQPSKESANQSANQPANQPAIGLFSDAIHLSIVTQFYPPDFAATGQFVEELAVRLAERIQVQVFTGQPGYAYQVSAAPPEEMRNGVRVTRSRLTQTRKRLGRTLSSLLFCVRSALHLMKRENRGDIVLFVSEPPYLQTLGYLANRLFNLSYACLVYDLYPDVAVELGVVSEHHWLVRFWNAVNRRVWRRAASIIVPSETMKERMTDRFPELVSKITVIHNWADPTWIKPLPKQDNTFAHTHNLVEKFTVLYSGNMGRCHDMNTILGAARELKDEPVQFVFIGGGPKRQDCIQAVQDWGLANCLFLPYQDKAALPESLTACDLSLVSIDVGMEGLVAPSKFYSAVSSGNPVAVICEPHSYLRQLVSEAKCGAAFNNGDSKGLAGFIRYLMKDGQMKGQMGDAGHHYIASNFTPELISQQYFKVLQRAVLKDADLQRAIAQQEFCLYYQPIMSLVTGNISGFEALIRWQHPERGLVYPNEFMDAAQESGLIVPMGWWVLNEACRQMRYWQIKFPQRLPLRISVNLATEQFLQPDLIPQIDRILDSNGLDGSCLSVEMSEKCLMADPAAAIAILLQLQARRISVCLDGFGLDYTSLKNLHRFPVNAIDIDRALVSQMNRDPEALKLIKTIAVLAHELDIRVTAEGVETDEQLQQLKAIGIPYAQGYYFSRAVDATAAQGLILHLKDPEPMSAIPSSAPSLPAATAAIHSSSDSSSHFSNYSSSHSSGDSMLHSAIHQRDIPLVLVVDDERMMRSLLRRAIEKAGYQAIEAESGSQAIALYHSHRPDLVLLDAMMPHMSGFECCAQLRQPASSAEPSVQAGLDYAPVLMITTLEDAESVDRAFTSGATDYITKPVNWALFRQRVQRLLQR